MVNQDCKIKADVKIELMSTVGAECMYSVHATHIPTVVF